MIYVAVLCQLVCLYAIKDAFYIEWKEQNFGPQRSSIFLVHVHGTQSTFDYYVTQVILCLSDFWCPCTCILKQLRLQSKMDKHFCFGDEIIVYFYSL